MASENNDGIDRINTGKGGYNPARPEDSDPGTVKGRATSGGTGDVTSTKPEIHTGTTNNEATEPLGGSKEGFNISTRGVLAALGTFATAGVAGYAGWISQSGSEEGSMGEEGSGAGSGSGDGDLEFAAEILEPTNNNELDGVELGESDDGYSGREMIGVGVFNTTGEDDDVFPSEETEYELTLENGDDPITVAEGKLEFGEIDEIGLDYKQIVRTLDGGVDKDEVEELAGDYTLRLEAHNGEEMDETTVNLTLGTPNFFGTLYTEEDNTEAIKERLAIIPPDIGGLNGTKVYDTKIMRNTASEEAYREGPGNYSHLPLDLTSDDFEPFLGDELEVVIENGNFFILVYDDPDHDRKREKWSSRVDEEADTGNDIGQIGDRDVYRGSTTNYRVFDKSSNTAIKTSNPALSDRTHEEVLTDLLRTLDADPEDYDEPVSVVDPGAEEELDRQSQWMRSEEFLDEHYIVGITGTTLDGSVFRTGNMVPDHAMAVIKYDPDEDVYLDCIYSAEETASGYEFELERIEERSPDSVVSDF